MRKADIKEGSVYLITHRTGKWRRNAIVLVDAVNKTERHIAFRVTDLTGQGGKFTLYWAGHFLSPVNMSTVLANCVVGLTKLQKRGKSSKPRSPRSPSCPVRLRR